MRPDLHALEQFRTMRDLALYGPLLNADERKAKARAVAAQAARDDAARASTPQLPLEVANG